MTPNTAVGISTLDVLICVIRTTTRTIRIASELSASVHTFENVSFSAVSEVPARGEAHLLARC